MTNRFPAGVAIIAGVAVGLRLRLGGEHDGADKVKVMPLPVRDLVGGDRNLCA